MVRNNKNKNRPINVPYSVTDWEGLSSYCRSNRRPFMESETIRDTGNKGGKSDTRPKAPPPDSKTAMDRKHVIKLIKM